MWILGVSNPVWVRLERQWEQSWYWGCQLVPFSLNSWNSFEKLVEVTEIVSDKASCRPPWPEPCSSNGNASLIHISALVILSSDSLVLSSPQFSRSERRQLLIVPAEAKELRGSPWGSYRLLQLRVTALDTAQVSLLPLSELAQTLIPCSFFLAFFWLPPLLFFTLSYSIQYFYFMKFSPF